MTVSDAPAPKTPPNRLVRRRQFVFVTALLAGAGLAFYFLNPGESSLFWTCPLHRLTGLHCPGCGMQRAAHALLHGHFAEALSLNAFIVLTLFPAAVYAYIAYALDVLFGIKRKMRTGRYFPAILALWTLAAIVFAVLRNIPAPPFDWLAP